MNALKLKSKLEDFHCGLSPSVNQPPLSVIHAVLESATPNSSGTGTSSYLVEVTLDHFRRTRLRNKYFDVLWSKFTFV
jgi:hypothetical protein